MVGDDANRAPAGVEQSRDLTDQPVQFTLDLAGKRDRAEMVAVLVDFTGLQPAARPRVKGHVQRSGVDDLIARGLHGFTEFLHADRAAGTLHRGLEHRAESVTSNLAGNGGDGRFGGGGHCRDRGPAVLDGGARTDRLQTFRQPVAKLVAQAVHKDDALVLAGDDGRLVTCGRKRLAFHRCLKRAGRVVQPRFEEVADRAGNGVLLLGGRHG